MKNKLIYFLFFILFSSFASAVCTISLDKSEYQPGEVATATMNCTDKKKGYTLEWSNSTTIIETDVGTTPDVINQFFFDTLAIPLTADWTNAFANLTVQGISIEAFFNVSGNGTQLLTINDVKFTPTILLGKIIAIEADVKDFNGNLIDDTNCFIYWTDQDDAPLQSCGQAMSHDGILSCSIPLDTQNFNENQQFLAKVRCSCGIGDNACFDEDGDNIDKKHGTGTFVFTIDNWLTVNTVTDKSSYTLDDDVINVCANLTNDFDQRISVFVTYNYRCGDPDNSTDRIVVGSLKELRGITGNTTQMQCAELDITNFKSIQNKVNTCYAATDVDVLSKKDATEVFYTYATTSPVFTLTSNSTSLQDNGGEMMISITILLVSVMFLLIYWSTKINVRDDNDDVVPLNSFVVLIMWTTAAFIAFFMVQLAAGIALTTGFGNQILSSVTGIHRFTNAITILLLFVMFFGLFINFGQGIIEWLRRQFE